jgi:hypothetical protein
LCYLQVSLGLMHAEEMRLGAEDTLAGLGYNLYAELLVHPF